MAERTRLEVVGLGPAGPDLLPVVTAGLLVDAESDPRSVAFLRTARHPAAAAYPWARTFDDRYEAAERFEDVYAAIVAELVDTARRPDVDLVVYAVPGSPLVAESTVAALRDAVGPDDPEVALALHPAVSFADLAYLRLGVDPFEVGALVEDASRFGREGAPTGHPVLLGQCWSREVLSDVKLAVEAGEGATAVLLHHLGLEDEVVVEVPWAEIDRTLAPDHLTSLWVPSPGPAPATEFTALAELVRTLRERCPWDRVQTHRSLARHLLEETHELIEVLDAMEDPPPSGQPDEVDPGLAAHLEEELGDVLFQVFFHAALAAERGLFTVEDVARSIREKLVGRHPHVFGDAVARTAEDVAAGWEVAKRAEKGRASVTDGIPAGLPALALGEKLVKKGEAVGVATPPPAVAAAEVRDALASLDADAAGPEAAIGELLLAVVRLARVHGVEAEDALRRRAAGLRAEIVAHEEAAAPGPPPGAP